MPDSVSNCIHCFHRQVSFHLLAAGAFLIAVLSLGTAQSQELGFAVSAGGTEDDIGLGVSVDESGNVYTTGYFRHVESIWSGW